jgi:hypothetical protein
VRVFPCAVNLASSVIALVSEDKISSGDLRQGIIFRATKQNSGSERIHSIGHGPSSADVTKIGPLGGRVLHRRRGGRLRLGRG